MSDQAYFRAVARHFQGWPAHYVAFDLETNGFGREALPVEFGYVEMASGSEVDAGARCLNWAGKFGVEADSFFWSLTQTGESMRSKGMSYRYTPDYVRSHGEDPAEVLKWAANVLDWPRQNASPVAGHNILDFDAELLARAMRKARVEFRPLSGEEILDIRLLERGREALIGPRAVESRVDWYGRLAKRRTKGESLDKCVVRYCRDEAARLVPVDRSTAHTGEGDSRAVAAVLEQMGLLSREESL